MNTRLMATLLGVIGLAALAAPPAETNTPPPQASAPTLSATNSPARLHNTSPSSK